MGQLNQHNDTNQRPSGLFNFSIKPNVAQKRLSEMPSHEFITNKFGGNVGRNPRDQDVNQQRSQSVLLDFSNSPIVQQEQPTQSKANAFNLLESLDFSGNVTPSLVAKEENLNVFDLTNNQNK